MKLITIEEAQADLPSLCDRAHAGETFHVTKNGDPWVTIAPVKLSKRSFGPIAGMSGSIDLNKFNATQDDQADLWEIES